MINPKLSSQSDIIPDNNFLPKEAEVIPLAKVRTVKVTRGQMEKFFDNKEETARFEQASREIRKTTNDAELIKLLAGYKAFGGEDIDPTLKAYLSFGINK